MYIYIYIYICIQKYILLYLYIYTYSHMIAYVFACSTHVSFGCPETEFCVSRMIQLSHHGVTPRSRHQTCSVGIDAWPSRAVPFSEDHEKNLRTIVTIVKIVKELAIKIPIFANFRFI